MDSLEAAEVEDEELEVLEPTVADMEQETISDPLEQTQQQTLDLVEELVEAVPLEFA